MKRLSFLLIMCALFSLEMFSKEYTQKFTSFEISGLDVTVIQSNTYKIVSDVSVECIETINGDTLKIQVIDQRGKMPKGKITIYTDNLKYLYAHNSTIDIPSKINTESLKISMAASRGHIDINSKNLILELGAGSEVTVNGETNKFYVDCGGGSTIDAKKLIAKVANIAAAGHSNVNINAKNVIIEELSTGSNLRNIQKYWQYQKHQKN